MNAKYDTSYVCGECGEHKRITDSGAVVCANGCGRVLAGHHTRRAVETSKRRFDFARWLHSFPTAEKVKGGYSINGQPGLFKRSKLPDQKSSRLNALSMAADGFIAARVGDAVYQFQAKPARKLAKVIA